MHSVDIDSETILFDGAWRSREELVLDIRAMLDAGSYGIARHSAALEMLAEAVADVRRVEFRATSSLAEDLYAAAGKMGRTPDALLRDAVARYLATLLEDPSLRPPAEPEGRRQTYPELAAVHPPGVQVAWSSMLPIATLAGAQPQGTSGEAEPTGEAAAPSALSAAADASPGAEAGPSAHEPVPEAEPKPERRWFDAKG